MTLAPASKLPIPDVGRDAAERFVRDQLGHLVADHPEDAALGSLRFTGGQRHADAALAAFDVTGYAGRRNEVYPQPRRGASGLSPYIRHGLLPLRTVWDHVAGGPARDVRKFRDELLWQEYARHWYARLGPATRDGLRRHHAGRDGSGWDRSMACIELPVDELEEDGWLVNQTRMWLASEWTVRRGVRWQDGEDLFFRHLLDGSRAANRLGWQWTVGVGSDKPYGFSRWQVEKRGKNLCASCDLALRCPIEEWPDEPSYSPGEEPVGLRGSAGMDRTGPNEVERSATPEVVWLTAESLGTDDPALAANPDLPVVFVFDEPLLASLRLSAKRLVFLTEILSELAETRDVELHLGRPVDVLDGRPCAVTHAPVPGFVRRARHIEPVEVHPWPWLAPPSAGSVASFSAWRKSVRAPR